VTLSIIAVITVTGAALGIGALSARRADGLAETVPALVEDGEGGRRPRDDGPGPTGATATTPPAAPATPPAAPGTPSSAPTPPRPPAP
jgi:hypothetical protein